MLCHLRIRSQDTTQATAPAVVPLVVADSEHANEVAAPYVVAMAYELAIEPSGYDVAVFTTDVTDRFPLKGGLAPVCLELGIPVWDVPTFVGWVRSSQTKPHDPQADDG